MATVNVTFDAATDYEQLMGQWSLLVGAKFLDWLSPAPEQSWLDVGCGTGAFTRLIAARCNPRRLCGIDPAPAQIEFAKIHSSSEFKVAGATEIPFRDAEFDIVTSALVLNFVPDRKKALGEMARVLRPGGLVTGYLWERSASSDSSPHSPMENGLRWLGANVLQPPMAPESTPEGAHAALKGAGFRDIAVTSLEVTRTFDSFETYWKTSTMLLAPTGKAVASLSPERQMQLREHMRSALPEGPGGSVSYASRALAFSARQ